MNLTTWIIILLISIFLISGIRIVRPTARGLIERLGKYHKFAQPGFHWIIPAIDRLYIVNITEQLVDAEKQEIITDDNLNARVDAQVYFKVKPTEEDVKAKLFSISFPLTVNAFIPLDVSFRFSIIVSAVRLSLQEIPEPKAAISSSNMNHDLRA